MGHLPACVAQGFEEGALEQDHSLRAAWFVSLSALLTVSAALFCRRMHGLRSHVFCLQGDTSDDGSTTNSHVNGFWAITGRLTLPTMDLNKQQVKALGGRLWMRQAPCLNKSIGGHCCGIRSQTQMSHFVMIGDRHDRHPIGLTQSVYHNNNGVVVWGAMPTGSG